MVQFKIALCSYNNATVYVDLTEVTTIKEGLVEGNWGKHEILIF